MAAGKAITPSRPICKFLYLACQHRGLLYAVEIISAEIDW
jgi:hypothetical protein